MDSLLRTMRTKLGMLISILVLAGIAYLGVQFLGGGLRSSLISDMPVLETGKDQIRFFRSYFFEGASLKSPTGQKWERTAQNIVEKTPTASDPTYTITTNQSVSGQGSSERIFRDWNISTDDNFEIEAKLKVNTSPCKIQGGSYISFSNGTSISYVLFCTDKIYVGDATHLFSSGFDINATTKSVPSTLSAEKTILVRVRNADIEILEKQGEIFVSKGVFAGAFSATSSGQNRIEFGTDVPSGTEHTYSTTWNYVKTKVYPIDQSKGITYSYDATKGTSPIKQGWITSDTTPAASSGSYALTSTDYVLNANISDKDKVVIDTDLSVNTPCESSTTIPYRAANLVHGWSRASSSVPLNFSGTLYMPMWDANQAYSNGAGTDYTFNANFSHYNYDQLPKLQISNGQNFTELLFCNNQILLSDGYGTRTIDNADSLIKTYQEASATTPNGTWDNYGKFAYWIYSNNWTYRNNHKIISTDIDLSTKTNLKITLENNRLEVYKNGILLADIPSGYTQNIPNNVNNGTINKDNNFIRLANFTNKNFVLSKLTAQITANEGILTSYFLQDPIKRAFTKEIGYDLRNNLSAPLANALPDSQSFTIEKGATDITQTITETSGVRNLEVRASANSYATYSYPWNTADGDIIDIEAKFQVTDTACSTTESNYISFSNSVGKGFITLCKDKLYVGNKDLPLSSTSYIPTTVADQYKLTLDNTKPFQTLYIQVSGNTIEIFADKERTTSLLKSTNAFIPELNTTSENKFTFGSKAISAISTPSAIKWYYVTSYIRPKVANNTNVQFNYNASNSTKPTPQDQGWINTPNLLGTVNNGAYIPKPDETNTLVWDANNKDALTINVEVKTTSTCPDLVNDNSQFGTKLAALPFIRFSNNDSQSYLYFCNNKTYYIDPNKDNEEWYTGPTFQMNTDWISRYCGYWGGSCGSVWYLTQAIAGTFSSLYPISYQNLNSFNRDNTQFQKYTININNGDITIIDATSGAILATSRGGMLMKNTLTDQKSQLSFGGTQPASWKSISAQITQKIPVPAGMLELKVDVTKDNLTLSPQTPITGTDGNVKFKASLNLANIPSHIPVYFCQTASGAAEVCLQMIKDSTTSVYTLADTQIPVAKTASYAFSIKIDESKKDTGNNGTINVQYRNKTDANNGTDTPSGLKSTITTSGTSTTAVADIVTPFTSMSKICIAKKTSDTTFDAEICKSGTTDITERNDGVTHTFTATFSSLVPAAQYQVIYYATRNDAISGTEKRQIFTIAQTAELIYEPLIFIPNTNKPQVFVSEKLPVPVPTTELPATMTYTKVKDTAGNDVLEWTETWTTGTTEVTLSDGSKKTITREGVPADSVIWLCVTTSADTTYKNKKCSQLKRKVATDAFTYTTVTDGSILPLNKTENYIWRVEQEPDHQILHTIDPTSPIKITYTAPVDPTAAIVPSYSISIQDVTNGSAKIVIETVKYYALSQLIYSFKDADGLDNPTTIGGTSSSVIKTTRTVEGAEPTTVYTITLNSLSASTNYSLTKIALKKDATTAAVLSDVLPATSFTTLPPTPVVVAPTREVPTSGGTTLSTGADIIAPSVAITSPKANITYATTPSITGTATDNVEVTKVDLELRKDTQYLSATGTWSTTKESIPAILDKVAGTWTYALPSTALTSGSTYYLKAIATDKSNIAANTSELQFVYNAAFTDTEKPVVMILDPINSQHVKTLTDVTLSATDNTFIDTVEVSIKDSSTATDSWSPTIKAGSTWKADTSKIVLTSGRTYDVTARAKDAYGNYSDITVTSKISIIADSTTNDTTAPKVGIKNITEGSTVELKSLQGYAYDIPTYGVIKEVNLSIQQKVSPQAFFNPDTNKFDSSTPKNIVVTLTKTSELATTIKSDETNGGLVYTWNYNIPATALSDNTDYVIHLLAFDAVNTTPGSLDVNVKHKIAPVDTANPTVTISPVSDGVISTISGTTSDDLSGVVSLGYTLEKFGTGQFYNATTKSYGVTISNPINKISDSYNNWSIAFPTEAFTNDTKYTLVIKATDGISKTGTSTATFTFKTPVTTATAPTTTTPTVTLAPATTTTTTVTTPSVLPGTITLPAGTTLPVGTVLPGTTTPTTAVTTTTTPITFSTGATLPAGTILPIGTVLPTGIVTTVYTAPTTTTPTVTNAQATTTPTSVTTSTVLTAPVTLPAGTILPGTTTPTTTATTLPVGATLAAGTILPVGTVLPTIIAVTTVASSAPVTTTPATTSTQTTMPAGTSTSTTLKPAASGSTLSGSTLTGSTMTGSTLKSAVVKDNGNNTISFPITFSAVTFAKDAVNASINATVTTTERLPTGTPLKICYQKLNSNADAVCAAGTQNTNGTFTLKTTIRSDEAASYNWILAVGDTPTLTYGTLDVKVNNGVSTVESKILKNDPMLSVTVSKDVLAGTGVTLKPAGPNQIAIEISVDKVTWTAKDKMMLAEVTFTNALSANLPVAICYTEKVTNAKQECITLTKTADKVYSATTNISAEVVKTYVWLVAVNNTPLNTDGILTISQKNGVFEALAQTLNNTKTTINVDKNLLVTATGALLTSTGSTLTCPPRCIVSSSLVSDVPVDNFAFTPIAKLIARGIMSGYADGSFKPANPINRAEFSKLTKNTFLIPTLDKSAALSFSDVTSTAWFYSFVRSLSQVGLIKGYADGTFRAGNNILRSEAAKIIALGHRMQVVRNANPNMTLTAVLEKADQDITASFIAFTSENPTYTYILLSDVPTNSWYAKYVYYAVRNDLIKGREVGGKKLFAPGAQILRGEAATLLSRVIDNLDIRYPIKEESTGAVTVIFPE